MPRPVCPGGAAASFHGGRLAEMRTLLFELRPAALLSADIDTLISQLVDAFVSPHAHSGAQLVENSTARSVGTARSPVLCAYPAAQ